VEAEMKSLNPSLLRGPYTVEQKFLAVRAALTHMMLHRSTVPSEHTQAHAETIATLEDVARDYALLSKLEEA
jgi:hypothetical protein